MQPPASNHRSARRAFLRFRFAKKRKRPPHDPSEKKQGTVFILYSSTASGNFKYFQGFFFKKAYEYRHVFPTVCSKKAEKTIKKTERKRKEELTRKRKRAGRTSPFLRHGFPADQIRAIRGRILSGFTA
jgi:hypothetical protein